MERKGQTDKGEQKKEMPTLEQLQKELEREHYRKNYHKALLGTFNGVLTIAALCVLLSMLMLPVFRVYGEGMDPALKEGDVVMFVKGSSYEKGDITAFYYNNKVLIKRVIATAGDWVDIDGQGRVMVNGKELHEPYVENPTLGECSITLPYQVPGGRVFVMGDNREISADSRSSVIGCVSEEQMIGRLAARVWPLRDIKLLWNQEDEE